ncbi:FAD-binding oxidoreductase [Roseovarius sp. SCSIO 43702]|uniref:NAD(P)/FAD-dependent oxidoreductase n=1 Tax=Roseovarius sp. SCSIO 43702 TaxID=2823043 RepID=UPI001C72E8A5|nr:FAD-binding oxidoreductase [Roseovarius sp. SCSIO 43702]QYX56652.1 FAD-binding oxidoreductase [Roseovarius sp. SCSIO 43702]
MRITRLPGDDRANGWSAILPPRSPNPPLAGEVRADWVVVGAGYAGLGAARRLAELHPAARIALIEAGEAGENASGRNSGFAIDLPHNVGSSLDELDGSHRFMRRARFAIGELDRVIEAEGIACDWSADGKYHTAVSERGRREVLEPFARELEALGEPYEWIEGGALRAALGSPHFTAAIRTPGGRLMNPAALCRGLADSLPKNVTLYENSPVTAFENSNGVTLTTPDGSLRAPKMILAANGFAERFGAFRGRFLHLVAHASLTRPLTEAERARYGVTRPWGLTPANAFAGITMRHTNDHRILIRQGLSYCPSQRFPEAGRRAVARRHKRLFDARFPGLDAVEMAHTWSGFVCLSRNAAPGFGRVAPNIWAATCQNAVGVTKGTFGGILAADMASGEDNPLIADMESLGTPSPLPPRPFLDMGVRARFARELWRNRHEA